MSAPLNANRPADHEQRMARARVALEGLSVGDGFGERFFTRAGPEWLATRTPPPGPWPYTDDTAMALSIIEVLDRCGGIDQDLLAGDFARRYAAEPNRGYGGMAHRILQGMNRGGDWRELARAAFGGQGSMGNGSAMRVAPLGAYFADDLAAAVEHARRSAAVTHAHPEGAAGAIATAVATAMAWRLRDDPGEHAGKRLMEAVLAHTPDGATKQGVALAVGLAPETDVDEAVAALGNGSRVTAPDTVPFATWCAARHLRDYEAALWTTARGGGDCDTTCAIVGGIVASATGIDGIPAAWRTAREALPF